MALFWRIWAAVILVNLGVLGIFVGLAILQFDSINSSLVGERLVVLAGRTAAPFQAAARIGLPLSTVRNADALLESARQTDDAIVAVHVFDESGQIVHSTDPRSRKSISPEVLATRKAAAGNPWHHETGEGFFSGIDIPRPDGTTAGGILVVYPGSGNVTQVRAMGAELSIAAVAVILAAAVLGMLLLRLGLGRQIRMFESVEAVISDFERVSWRSAARADTPPTDHKPGELRRLLDTAENRYRVTGCAIETAREVDP